MARAQTPNFPGYALAIVSLIFVVAVKEAFGSNFDGDYLVLALLTPVLLTIWFGDLPSSLLAVGLCGGTLMYYFQWPYEGAPPPRSYPLVPVIVFFAQGLFLCWLTEVLRSRSERSMEMANAFLETMKSQQIGRKDKDSDEVLTRLVQNLPDVIFRLDQNLRFVYASPVLSRHFDAAATEIHDQALAEAKLPAEMLEVLQSECRLAMEKCLTRVTEFSVTVPRGRRTYKGKFIPEINERGWAVSVLCILTDVTRTKNFEQELQRFRAMSRTSNDLCFCADITDGRLTFANQRALDQLGYSDSDILDLTLKELHDGFDGGILQSWLRDLAAQDKLAPFEAVFKDKNGRKLPVDLTLSLLEIDGKVHLCGVARDASERKLAEQSLRIFRERLELVVQSIGLGLWYCDLPFDKLIWNDQCKEHFGLAPDAEVTIDTFFALLHPDDRERTRTAIEAAIATGASYDIDYRTQARDGRERWLRAIGRCFFDAQGKPIRFDGVTLDTTERKRTEEALKESDRRKNQFLAILSHELRNPLAAIRNAMHLFNGVRLADPIFVESRAIIDRQSQLLGGMVDDLLDVFRITHEKIVLRRETLDLTNVVRQVVADLRNSLTSLGLTIDVDIPEEPVWVDGDRLRLTQVLLNILNNAGKFTPRDGKIFVTLRADPLTRTVSVSVCDTGKGIDSKTLPHVFETFSQGEQDLARGAGGLGLGLALVRGLVELHGGAVWAKSAGLDQGAEFTFRLPQMVAPTLPPTPVRSDAPPAGEQCLRLLVVEDNVDTARTMALLLRRSGHQVDLAHSGLEGVQKAKTFKPNVVLCDLGLPEMDGYDVARALRADPDTAHTRLIAISGYGQDAERQRSKEAGFDLHLTKPVDPIDLQRLLSVLKIDA